MSTPRSARAVLAAQPSEGERAMETHLRQAGLWAAAVPEYAFALPRKWRFDFAFVHAKLAIEVEGGIWVDGAHSRGSGFEEDCIKYAEAAVRGWRVIRVTTAMVLDGRAIEYVRRALE